jgi:predicted peptidase
MKHRPLSLPLWGAYWLLFPAVALAQQAQPVQTVEFNSDSVGRKMKYNIVLPTRYEQTNDRYPVLYLLHGYSSNYTAWARMRVPEYARAYDLIVVMPDAGNSWYVNWAKSEDGQKNRWEDAIIKDLIGHVDATYRTIGRREGRAINGLSMGGYGGLMLGLRHPDLFCSIGSHSGAVAFVKTMGERMKKGEDTPRPKRELSSNPDPRIGIEGFSSQVERSPKGQMFATPEDCAAYDPFELVLKVPRDRLPHIYLDCGTEDRLIDGSQAFVKLLMDNKIPFTYAQSGGGHTAPYWAREVGHSMAVQYAILVRSQALAQKGAQALQEKRFEKDITVKATINYLLYLPEGYGKDDRAWPLVLFLHGASESGSDLNKVKTHGPPKLAAGGKDLPFILVAPQSARRGWDPATLNALLDDVVATHKVDRDRIYVTGLSMGGYGTWALAAAYPERFAAVVPICGGGNPADAGKLKDLPIWVFHGGKDRVVPPSQSEDMVKALKEKGAANIKYTLYPEAGHDSWTEAYNDPELYQWLLRQKRAAGKKP